MRMRLTVKSGHLGTKNLLAHKDERLTRVRYRDDAQRKRCLKTVELIIEEPDWRSQGRRRAGDRLAGVLFALWEVGIRHQLKRVGGRSDPKRRVWELRYDRMVE